MKQATSLIRRQWLASALCLPLLVGFSAYTLNRAFVSSLDSAESDALLAQIYSLIALSEPDGKALELPSYLPNPKLETPESGLYARVLNEHGKVIWRSNSLESSSQRFASIETSSPGIATFHAFENANSETFRAISFKTIWEIASNDAVFTFEVFHAQGPKQQEITNYQKSLIFWLLGMAVLLIIIQSLVAKWGLKPLSMLAKEIEEIEAGKQQKIESPYPKEILPVSSSLTKLLQSELEQRGRYKNALSDLAHSLKTPLSAVRAQLGNSLKDQAIDEQVQRMSMIIDHQLKRASAEVKSIYGPDTKLAPLIERLCGSLAKVYREKQIDFNISIIAGASAKMHENDLMEVLGNIIENACKYGNQKVSIRYEENPTATIVHIEDDGPGVAENMRNEILVRGARADTSQIGQGIGLSIASDILSSYNGGLKISPSTIGGARFSVMVPKQN